MSSAVIVDLNRVPPAGRRFEMEFPPEGFFPEGDDVRAAGPVRFHVTIRPTSYGFVARGRVELRVSLLCGRCLGPMEQELASDWTAEYRPRPERFDEEVHIRKEDLELSYLEGDTLNLREMAVEQALLLVPMKPLCSEACRGLCPACGTDRNRGECGCVTEAVDPRLQALEEIRRKMST